MADLDLNRLLQGGMDLARAFGRGDDAYNAALAKRAQTEGLLLDARNKRDAAMAKNDLVGLLMESGEPADRQRALAVRGGVDPKLLGFGGKTNEAFTLSPGSKRFDAAGKVIAEVPFAPANMQYVDVPDGYGGTIKALFEPRGGSFRQPQYGGFSTYEDGSPVTLSSSVGPNGQPFNFDPSLTSDQRRVVMADIASGGASDNYTLPPSSTHQFGRTPPKQKDAPAGYRWSADGASQEFVPGGPADPAVKRAQEENKPKKPIPTTALKMMQDSREALSVAEGMGSELARIYDDLKSGRLVLGPVQNQLYRARNAAGQSNDQSKLFQNMMNTFEKMRNDSLRLNKGVQTEGDAVRAWNELFGSLSDGGNVMSQLDRIQRINERAIQLHRENMDSVNNEYGQPQRRRYNRATGRIE